MLHHAINAISWAEIPVMNFERARKFYSEIFDFDMPEMQMGPNRMGLLRYDREKGGIGAAIVQGMGYVPTISGMKVYLHAGKDLKVVLDRVEAANGRIVHPKTQIAPEMGFFATIEDSEGNHVNLHSMA